jgi:hypothetical protein
MMTFPSDAIDQSERALLGSVLLNNSLWQHAAKLSNDDFCLDSHRRIFAHMAGMSEGGRPIDLITITGELSDLNQLECCGGPAYLGSLIEGCIPENISAYSRAVRTAAKERRAKRLIRSLAETCKLRSADKWSSLRELGQQLQTVLSHEDSDCDEWKALFHSYEEIINVPEARFAIDGFLQEEGITLIGGLVGHGKTLCMLAMVRALLEGGKLFHHFAVNTTSQRVIYLIPEAGLGPFSARLKTFHLEQHVREGRLYCRTLSSQSPLLLTDARLLSAVKGADVFLDTAIRFMVGDENSAAEQKLFAETLFSLQRAGARTITGAHHSPKSFGKDNVMTLENVLRGSGDIGAMLTTCWGLSQVDAAANRIFVQNVKARDFLPCDPFVIQGRPSIDSNGYFDLAEQPGFAGSLSENKSREKGGRPELPDKSNKIAEAHRLKEQGLSYRDIARALEIPKSTVGRLLSETQ